MPQTGVAVSRGERGEIDERRAERAAGRADRRSGSEGLDGQRSASAGPGVGVPGRRTVTIRGQGAERYSGRRVDRSRRPRERRYERAGFRPDRAAFWAFLLAVMLIFVAVASAHAATL